MKKLTALALCCAAAFLAGCSSGVEDDVRSALTPREAPRTRVFQADSRATYAAARAAAEEMGYRYVKGGPAEGTLEALSEISTGDTTTSSRQISMRVTLSPADPTGTAVQVALDEILESDSSSVPGVATEAPLRDTPLYEVFFRNLGKALQAPAKE
jgi:hypothetical protein